MHQIWAEGEWVTWVIWCFAKRTLHKTWCTSVWWSCQSPAAHSCGLLNQWNSFHGGMLKLNAKSDADLSLYPLSHCECDCHTVHMLTQQRLPPPLTSTVKSSLFTHAHSSPSPWLPGYIDVVQTFLIILTIAGLFLDRPHIRYIKYTHKYII